MTESKRLKKRRSPVSQRSLARPRGSWPLRSSTGIAIALITGLPLAAQAAVPAVIEDEALAPKAESMLAQTTAPLPRSSDLTPPSLEPLPDLEPLPEDLPPPEELLGPDFEPVPLPETPLPETGATIVVEQFVVTGSTVFTQAEFDAVTAPFRDRPITFTEVQAARDAVTQLYVDNGYVTSGAVLPPQSSTDGVIQLEAVEGSVEDIVVEGTWKLKPAYISSRLNQGVGTPLQINDLLEQVQLLQLNPLVESISADLQAGTAPGTNLLVATVVEADSFDVGFSLDNNRNPAVGSVRGRVLVNARNLTGFGDALTLSYSRSDGGGELDAFYTIPVNPQNGSITLSYGRTDSDLVDDLGAALNISSEAEVLELTYRQPIIQTLNQDLTLGLIGSYETSQTFIDDEGFPLSPGANNDGETKVTALRFLQEWVKRDTDGVMALRSLFSFGVDAFDATVNDGDIPDSQFFAWLGQGQWVKQLAPDTPLIVRGRLQLSPDALLPSEQFSLGGQATVRGYRQDTLLADNGLNLSVEARIPVWRAEDSDTIVQLTPFIDGGYGWNSRGPNPDDNTLLGIGTGLLVRLENQAAFRLDWGIPLIDDDEDGTSLQEQGLYFSLGFSFF